MAFINLFAPPVAAMRADSTAFKVISDNIANSVTPGYKAADTRFGELLTQSPSSTTSYYGGTYPQVQNFIDKQGTISQTQRAFDVAINGRGFLVSNTALDGSGSYLLSRAGQLVGTNVQSRRRRSDLPDGSPAAPTSSAGRRTRTAISPPARASPR